MGWRRAADGMRRQLAGRFRLFGRGVLALVTVAWVALVSVGGTSTPASSADPRPLEQTFAVAAVALAARAGQRVEVTSARTETGQVFANPNGTFTSEESAVPVRVRRGTGWVPVDPTLTRGRDGQIRP